MFDRSELAAAALVCVGAALAGLHPAQTALVPAGFLAGLAAVGSPSYADAVVRGGKAGALGGVLFVTLTGLGVAARMASFLGPLFAVDVFLFTSFAMAVMLVPLYGIEGLVVGPLVQWLGGKANEVKSGSRDPR
ncbi:hypothetical protein BRC81_13950 [Halobacteriales archaeon QS_1_68_20]|nr:MAG: hypothetical protein BRC81_13950 [Halobacteriales archaeon QS_1_68_20]